MLVVIHPPLAMEESSFLSNVLSRHLNQVLQFICFPLDFTIYSVSLQGLSVEVRQASTVDPPAAALMCSHRFLKISEIIASNWSLKRRMLPAEVFFWAGWKAPNY